MSAWYDPRQTRVLARRYRDVLLGDLGSVVLLLASAPLLAVAVGGVYMNISRDAQSLYFVVCLSAFFLGAVNSAREIVKERALFLREKMFNLKVGSYLASKYRVQAVVVVLEAVLLGVVVDLLVTLRVSLAVVLPLLALVGFAGAAVGLLISSAVKTADKAMTLVPLVVIPQILFSDFVIGKGQLKNWTGTAQDLMPVHWGYKVLVEIRDARDVDLGIAIGGPAVVLLTIGVCFLASVWLLSRARYS